VLNYKLHIIMFRCTLECILTLPGIIHYIGSDRIGQFCNRLRAQSPLWRPSILGTWDRHCDERYRDWNDERFDKGFIDFRDLVESNLEPEPRTSTPVKIPLRLMAEFCLSQDIWLDEDIITEELASQLGKKYPFKKIFETSQAILSVLPERTQTDEDECWWSFCTKLFPEDAFVNAMNTDQEDDKDNEGEDCDITSDPADGGFTTRYICREHLRIKVLLIRRNVRTLEAEEEYLTKEQYLGILKRIMTLGMQELKALV